LLVTLLGEHVTPVVDTVLLHLALTNDKVTCEP